MHALSSFFSAALVSIFLQNSIFERALGINILLYASRRRSYVISFTLGLCYITTFSSAVVWVINRFLSDYKYFRNIMPVLYIVVIGIIYILSLIFVWRFFPKFFKEIKKYIHLTVFNCAVLGALFINAQLGADFFGYIGYGLGTGLGFFAAGYLLYVAHPRLNSELVPDAFRGTPIMTVYVGILSLALQALTGYTAVV